MTHDEISYDIMILSESYLIIHFQFFNEVSSCISRKKMLHFNWKKDTAFKTSTRIKSQDILVRTILYRLLKKTLLILMSLS